MITVQLGQTTVPAIGVGTWNIGEEPAKHAEEVKAIQTAIDAGATVIDTAEMVKDVQKNLPVKRLSHLTGQNFISSTRYYPRMPVINDWKKVLIGVLS